MCLRNLLHIVWPVSCPVCGRLAVKVCPECLGSLASEQSKFCVACRRDFPCASHPDGLACSSVSRYRGANSDVIKSMKYASRKAIAVMMGEIIAGCIMRPDADILVPIPLHKGSEREYNQTELIARGASVVWGIPVKNCLRWRIYSPNQASSSDHQERVLPLDAMEAVCDVRSLRVLLVDDVCTTGNTLMAAAVAVTRAGASVGEAVTWSRSI